VDQYERQSILVDKVLAVAVEELSAKADRQINRTPVEKGVE